MGYEFGYSLEYPDGLVAWEAQFGDFANNGQVMIDQFIAAAEDKWKLHERAGAAVAARLRGRRAGALARRGSSASSSSRREDNIQVCYPTTAAQIFHLLRRQVLRRLRKPLVVMTPKSLLRLAEAGSPWSDFAQGTYRRVIADTAACRRRR